MSRSRARTTPWFLNTYSPLNASTPNGNHNGVCVTALISDEKDKPCNCIHTTNTVYSYQSSSTAWDQRYDGTLEGFNIHPDTTYYIVRDFERALNTKKLSTSNEAGLLQNLAELDDTVSMFGKDLLKSVSYGGYKWGWAPLLSDVAKVNDVIARAAKNPPGLPQPYADENTITKSVDIIFCPRGGTPGNITHTWELKTKFEGTISYDLDILSYYDFIGFHPSPKLIWDLVPLSFAVDWVLPIGDMIDRISPTQGWVKSANFSGWQMITATCTEKITKPWFPWDSISHGPNIRRTFTRNFVTNIALEQKTVYKEIGLKWPSFSNVLDYAYLANSFASGSNTKRR